MKKIILMLIGILLLAGCTADQQGHFIAYGQEDGTYSPLQMNQDTSALVIVTDVQHQINEGNTFYSYDVTDLGNGANRTILLDTLVSTKEAHLYWVVNMELEATVHIYEDSTVSDNGTAMLVYNRNRNSAVVNETLLRHTPTVNTTGTLIYETQLAAGGKAGGTDSSLDEIILKRGTRYLMVITNQTSSSNVVSGKMIWYELQTQ